MVNNLLDELHVSRFDLGGTRKSNQKVMFSVFKDHIDRLVLEDNFLHSDHVLVADLSV